MKINKKKHALLLSGWRGYRHRHLGVLPGSVVSDRAMRGRLIPESSGPPLIS
jgi:hypothetical protein